MRYLIIAAMAACISANAQTYKDPKAPVEKRVDDLLSQMTLEEKIDYIGGYKGFYIRGMERFGLPEIKMTDGPVGTRNYGPTTAYPASVLTAATWDRNLGYRLGEALGNDARERGVHILLAPGVNLYRAPMNGRNFEYMGEDPYLAGEMAVGYIKGVQDKGVVATVKHYAANNQEWDRNNVSSDLDERTLQELYLPAFKAAVQKGKVAAVMNSYNLINGEHATQHHHLNNEILKGDWGFDGILMSDWVATYDGVAAAKGGLDLEMPSGAFMNRENLLPAIKNGTLSEEVINDKVRRILRIIFRFGFYDTEYGMAEKLVPNTESEKVALDLARGGMVLLKNEGGILPLSKSVKTIAVVGPNSNGYIAGGGSSYTQPFHYTSLLEGIKKAAPNATVNFVDNSIPEMENYIASSPFYTSKGAKTHGLKAEYFKNMKLEGKPEATFTDSSMNHNWPAAPDVLGMPDDNFSIRFTGVVRPEKTASYKFAVRGDDGYRLYVDEKLVIDMWNDHAATLKNIELPLEAGKEYNIRLEYYENSGGAVIAFAVYHEVIDFSAAEKSAAGADVVILSAGYNMSSEGEGFDRTYELPPYQEALIKAVTFANPNTVVVLYAGGNTAMQNWLPQTKGLLHAWYPGQEGGTAIAELLFGTVTPSGKLPASFEKRWEENPTFDSYYDADNNKLVSYNEGMNLGYRFYDRSRTKPLFPFGYGLSYTTFEYSGLKISGKGTNVTVTYKIKNTGKYDGAEISQVYVRQPNSPVQRPVKELKGFDKIFLKKGETKTVTVTLDADAFSYYKTDKKAWGYDPGTYEIIVGASAEDVKLKGNVTVK